MAIGILTRATKIVTQIIYLGPPLPKDERCPISIDDLSDTLFFGTETQGPRCQKEGSSKATQENPKLIGEDMPALGNGALKNAKISSASKVWIMMLMN